MKGHLTACDRAIMDNYSGREATSLKMGSVCLFVCFAYLLGSTSSAYADWLARRQYSRSLLVGGVQLGR